MPDNIVRAILIAHVQPKDNLEDEFNRWYDDIHIPQVGLCQGLWTGPR